MDSKNGADVELCLLLTPSHLRYLPKVLSDLGAFHRSAPVIIVASGFSRFRRRFVRNMVETHLPGANLLFFKAGSVGENRNRAVASSTRNFVAFFDSDDRYFPSYLSLIDEAFLEHPDMDVFLHGYIPAEGANADELFVAQRETLGQIPTKAKFTLGQGVQDLKAAKPAQGHMCVRSSLAQSTPFHCDQTRRNEDSLFLAEVMKGGARIVLSDYPSSVYRMGSSSQFLRSRIERYLSRAFRRRS